MKTNAKPPIWIYAFVLIAVELLAQTIAHIFRMIAP